MTDKGFSGNALKFIAMFCMTADHVGCLLLPQHTWLRIIGRLAFPIYAYLIAEGCRHTRSMGRYLGSLFAIAAVCQGVYFVAMGSVYLCILVTFSLSVALIWLLKWALQKHTRLAYIAVAAGVLLALFLAEILPILLTGTDYAIDYGFPGIILPVCIYLCKSRKQELLITALVLIGMAAPDGANIQWFALLSLPFLALYSGSRGKWKLKWLFYFYYPVHLAVIWLFGTIL